MEDQEAIQGPAVVSIWQWQSDADPFQGKDPAKWTWKNYSDGDCLLIEEAFTFKKETLDLQDHQIDLKKMLQVSKKSKNRVRRVRRQVQSRFMMEMPEPKIVIQEQNAMNEAFGAIQHFLGYIMKRTPEAYGLYQRLKTLALDSKKHKFEDLLKQVLVCIERRRDKGENYQVKNGLSSHKFYSRNQENCE